MGESVELLSLNFRPIFLPIFILSLRNIKSIKDLCLIFIIGYLHRRSDKMFMENDKKV